MNESPRSYDSFGTNDTAARAASEGQSLAREERFTVEAHVDVHSAVEDVDARASVQPVVVRLSVDLVGACPAVQDVAAFLSQDSVCAARTDEVVRAVAPAKRVRARPARD